MITALCNSMKLRAMPRRATQDRWIMVESSDKTWSAGEGNGKPIQSVFLPVTGDIKIVKKKVYFIIFILLT